MASNDSRPCVNHTVAAFMYPTAYSIFFIIGLPGNCLSLYVAWMLMKKGNNLAVYLINLSVSDLLYTVTLPIWIMKALNQEVNSTLCSLIAVIMYNSFYVGSGLLCCISVDRYLGIVFPLYFDKVHTVRTAVLVSLVVWLAEIGLHIALMAYDGILLNFSISHLCVDNRLNSKRAHVAIIRVVLGFFFPLLLMTFCFQQIIHAISKSPSTVARERQKIRNLLLLLLVIYMVAFTPYQVVMFIRGVFEPENADFAVCITDYYTVFVATTTINSVADPIVYCLVTESAKAEMLKIISICRSQFSKAVYIMRSPSTTTT